MAKSAELDIAECAIQNVAGNKTKEELLEILKGYQAMLTVSAPLSDMAVSMAISIYRDGGFKDSCVPAYKAAMVHIRAMRDELHKLQTENS